MFGAGLMLIIPEFLSSGIGSCTNCIHLVHPEEKT